MLFFILFNLIWISVVITVVYNEFFVSTSGPSGPSDLTPPQDTKLITGIITNTDCGDNLISASDKQFLINLVTNQYAESYCFGGGPSGLIVNEGTIDEDGCFTFSETLPLYNYFYDDFASGPGVNSGVYAIKISKDVYDPNGTKTDAQIAALFKNNLTPTINCFDIFDGIYDEFQPVEMSIRNFMSRRR